MDVVSYLLGKNASGSSGFDWSVLGYNSTPQIIIEAYNAALEIKNNWTSTSRLYDYKDEIIVCPYVDTSTRTSWWYFAGECLKLLQVPLLDTSNITNMGSAFVDCRALTTVPIFDTSNVTNFSNMFSNCLELSDESLDNVLQMCINATSYTGTKTLKTLGIVNTNRFPTTRIQGLPSYQDFIDAGWTIGD